MFLNPGGFEVTSFNIYFLCKTIFMITTEYMYLNYKTNKLNK